ncbi:hypothetical protein [Pedobacter miscanthi]|uniref:Uncharacterized protein n=1 Tax=Pedobacter miscanthi TaxID=2259170 RepID=A0A366L4W7_9SPHI|nr:hypothetical protein [Pedobacter miscanthi]RBQ08928.1 hypothetical protein DRW42_06885 [Pedobacter miscanthi]
MKRSYSFEKKKVTTGSAKIKPFHLLVLFYATIVLLGIPIRLLQVDALTVISALLSLIVVIVGYAFYSGKKKR